MPPGGGYIPTVGHLTPPLLHPCSVHLSRSHRKSRHRPGSDAAYFFGHLRTPCLDPDGRDGLFPWQGATGSTRPRGHVAGFARAGVGTGPPISTRRSPPVAPTPTLRPVAPPARTHDVVMSASSPGRPAAGSNIHTAASLDPPEQGSLQALPALAAGLLQPAPPSTRSAGPPRYSTALPTPPSSPPQYDPSLPWLSRLDPPLLRPSQLDSSSLWPNRRLHGWIHHCQDLPDRIHRYPFYSTACVATLTAQTCAMPLASLAGSSTTELAALLFCVAPPIVDPQTSTPSKNEATAACLPTTPTSTSAVSASRSYRLIEVHTGLCSNRNIHTHDAAAVEGFQPVSSYIRLLLQSHHMQCPCCDCGGC